MQINNVFLSFSLILLKIQKEDKAISQLATTQYENGITYLYRYNVYFSTYIAKKEEKEELALATISKITLKKKMYAYIFSLCMDFQTFSAYRYAYPHNIPVL